MLIEEKADGMHQNGSHSAQERLQIGEPIIVVSQDYTSGSFQQDWRDFSIGFIGRSQKQAGEQTRPTELSMQTKARKDLPICVILAKAGFASKTNAPRCSRKTTDS